MTTDDFDADTPLPPVYTAIAVAEAARAMHELRSAGVTFATGAPTIAVRLAIEHACERAITAVLTGEPG